MFKNVVLDTMIGIYYLRVGYCQGHIIDTTVFLNTIVCGGRHYILNKGINSVNYI